MRIFMDIFGYACYTILLWYMFYPQIGTSLFCSVVIILIGCIVRAVMPIDNWILFFLACGIIAILGLGSNMMIVLRKDERKYLIDMIKRKLIRRAL